MAVLLHPIIFKRLKMSKSKTKSSKKPTLKSQIEDT